MRKIILTKKRKYNKKAKKKTAFIVYVYKCLKKYYKENIFIYIKIKK